VFQGRLGSFTQFRYRLVGGMAHIRGILSERQAPPLAGKAHRLDKYSIGSERIVGLVRTAQFRQLDADIRRANGSTRGRSGVYTTNIATSAANIATVVIVTTDHPKPELGWSCIDFVSKATTRIATGLIPMKSSPTPTPVESRIKSAKRPCLFQFLVQTLAPPKRFCECIRRRSCQRRDGKKSDSTETSTAVRSIGLAQISARERRSVNCLRITAQI